MDKKKKTALLVAGGAFVLVLIAVIVVLVVLLLGKKDGQTQGQGEEPKTYVMNEGNYQQIQENMEAEVQEGYFETYMNMEWTFPDGTSETTDAILGNSSNNTKPIRCEVVLAGTEQVIFRTEVLPVGTRLPPFKLDVDLEAGTYDAVCEIYLLEDAGDGTYKDYSSAGFNITITVEN